ncbi:MAG: type I pullulanase [Clostridia bacterium]|nr:type I pullulanase [Clostridia bacterium]
MNNYKHILCNSGAKLDKFKFDGTLGAIYSKESTEFRLWSPIASCVKVRLYKTGSDSEMGAGVIGTYKMTKNPVNGVWSYTVQGDLNGVYYTYLVSHPQMGERETGDIYAKAAGVNGERSMVIDLPTTNPDGWDKDDRVLFEHPTDAVIWEVQVRDFSYCESSGVSEKNRGKFLAFTEHTTLNGKEGGKATCVDYLKELGINCVQINPFYDFGSVDEASDREQYNWGYDPKNYNLPEGSFSSDPYKGDVRIRECKQMIQALHDAGIAVVMDVVYNHTYTGHGSWFDISVPGYYYRYNAEGFWSNGSGCGNDTASEHEMYRKFMIDSVMYWAQEYHLDGFRFDLMGLHDVETMKAIREALNTLPQGEKILMYGEAWDMFTSCEPGTKMANQHNMHLLPENVGAFCDNIRDAVKGSEFEQYSMGFVQNGSRRNEVFRGMRADTDFWAKTPTQAVNYASCHDGRTMYDKLCLSVFRDNSRYHLRHENILRMNRLAAAIMLTSQGIPFMVAGEEMARTKLGDHNSYKSPSKINRIDWNRIEEYSDLVDYYRGLIELRKKFAPFRDHTGTAIQKGMWLFTDNPTGAGYTLEGEAYGKRRKMLLLFNGAHHSECFDLASHGLTGWWDAVVNSEEAGTKFLGEYSRTICVPATSALILVEQDEITP